MIERKLLKKYCPPGEWLNIPRPPTNQPIKARMILPMSIRCHTCGNDIYKRTKCNSRKEGCIGETYLGIRIYRFRFKCTRCSAEITLKTDPQNSDYTVESGASRIERWGEEVISKQKRKWEAEEICDAMKALENGDVDSKQDMDIHIALEEMCTMKINGSSESVLNPTDVLPKTNGPESANKEVIENKNCASMMPKFMVKPKPTAMELCKKQKIEPTAGQDNRKAPIAEENSEAAEKTNFVQSLCQTMTAMKVMTEDSAA